MALITCPECNGEVSDKASSCPHCGYPLENIENNEENIFPEAANKEIEEVELVKRNSIEILDEKNSEASGNRNISKTVIVVIGVAIVILFSLVAIFLSTSDFRAYKKAQKLYEEHKYVEAQDIFIKLDEYKDSLDWYNKAKYGLAIQYMNQKDYVDAYSEFEKIYEYNDSAEQMLECIYLKAKEEIDKGEETKDTYFALIGLGNYKDSQDLANETVELVEDELYDLAVTKYNWGDFDEALVLFEKIGNYKESNSYIELAKIMQKYQGVYESTLTKNIDYFVLDGWYLYEYEINSKDRSIISRDYEIVTLYELDGQLYLIEELYKDNPGDAFVFYALIETDDGLLRAIDQIYLGHNLDYLYVMDTDVKKEDLNASYQHDINRAEPTIGMTIYEVQNSTWGEPVKINRTTTAYGEREQWVYGNGKYIYFEDGAVITIQE